MTPVPLVLSGFSVPAGTHVDLNPFVHFRSPAHFPSPDAHRPERWLRGHGDAGDVHPFLFIPFSRGPRMCPGKRLLDGGRQTVLGQHRPHANISSFYVFTPIAGFYFCPGLLSRT